MHGRLPGNVWAGQPDLRPEPPMWVIVHTYVGLAIASLVHRPFWQVAVLVIVSHVLLDLVPHWDYGLTAHPLLWGWLDFGGATATLIVLLVAGYPWTVVLMGPISGAPDFDVLFFVVGQRRGRKWFPSHWDGFPHGRCGKKAGVTLQVAIMAASLAVVVLAHQH
jgi:hypothetical protein